MSTPPTSQGLADFYHHIDNGGISLSVSTQVYEEHGEVFDVPQLKIEASYHGYPSVSSCLSGAELTPKVLRQMAQSLSEAADWLEQLRVGRED